MTSLDGRDVDVPLHLIELVEVEEDGNLRLQVRVDNRARQRLGLVLLCPFPPLLRPTGFLNRVRLCQSRLLGLRVGQGIGLRGRGSPAFIDRLSIRGQALDELFERRVGEQRLADVGFERGLLGDVRDHQTLVHLKRGRELV